MVLAGHPHVCLIGEVLREWESRLARRDNEEGIIKVGEVGNEVVMIHAATAPAGIELNCPAGYVVEDASASIEDGLGPAKKRGTSSPCLMMYPCHALV